jgi:hypothetical protein
MCALPLLLARIAACACSHPQCGLGKLLDATLARGPAQPMMRAAVLSTLSTAPYTGTSGQTAATNQAHARQGPRSSGLAREVSDDARRPQPARVGVSGAYQYSR